MRIVPALIVPLIIAGLAHGADVAKPATPAQVAADTALARYATAQKAADDAANAAREKALKGPREAVVKDLQTALDAAMKAKDLDTAKAVDEKLKEIQADTQPKPAAGSIAARFLGRWGGTTTVTADGKLKHDSGRTAAWSVQGNKLVMRWQDGRVEVGEFIDFIQTYDHDGKPQAQWTRTPKGQ